MYDEDDVCHDNLACQTILFFSEVITTSTLESEVCSLPVRVRGKAKRELRLFASREGPVRTSRYRRSCRTQLIN